MRIRSIAWLLFLTLSLQLRAALPPVALALRLLDGSPARVLSRDVRLKISVEFVQDDSASKAMVKPLTGYECSSAITENDARRKLEGLPRFARGVGSRPPECTNSCGDCSPCLPVSLPVGGMKTDDEYYPEVWRCECNSKFFNP